MEGEITMLTNRARLVAIAAAVISVGCAQFDPVVSVRTSKSKFDDAAYRGVTTVVGENTQGLEEFRVFRQAATGFDQLSHMQDLATSEAIRYCAIRNSRPVFFRETVSQPPHVLGNWPRAEIVFGCRPLEKP